MCTSIFGQACKPQRRKVLFYTSVWVVLVGLSLHIIGVAAPSWSTHPGNNNRNITSMGLWQECSRDDCSDHDLVDIRIVRAFALIPAASGSIGLLLLLIFACKFHRRDNRDGKRKPNGVNSLHIAIGAIMSTGVFIVIGSILWVCTVHDKLTGDWSIGAAFGLSLSGGPTMILGVMMAYCGSGKANRVQPAQSETSSYSDGNL